MKLYLISQNVNQGYDTYDSAVVATTTVSKARNFIIDKYDSDSWCNPEDVKVKYLGEAAKSVKEGLICASFNAG